LKGLGMKNVGVFYGHWACTDRVHTYCHFVYFVAIWKFYVNWYIFTRFGIMYQGQSGNSGFIQHYVRIESVSNSIWPYSKFSNNKLSTLSKTTHHFILPTL
jgi:hypothetical protein